MRCRMSNTNGRLTLSSTGPRSNDTADHCTRSWSMVVTTTTVTAIAVIPIRMAQTRRIRSLIMARIIWPFRPEAWRPSILA
jgi:hypothetical protein